MIPAAPLTGPPPIASLFLNSLSGSMALVPNQVPLEVPDDAARSASLTPDSSPADSPYAISLLPNHLEYDIYWDDGSS